MTESRKLKRRHTDAYLYVYDSDTDDFFGRVVDMTAEGVRLRCIVDLDVDIACQFTIKMPMEICGSMEISFEAKSIWSKECDDTDEYFIGFQLQNVPADEQERIDLLLMHPLFKDASELVNVTISRK